MLLLICLVLPQTTLAQVATFTDLESIRALEEPEKSYGKLVDFEATVTYVSEIYEFIFVQSGQEAIFVYKPDSVDMKAGQQVRIQGKLAKGDLYPIISDPSVTLIRQGVMPPAITAPVIGLEHDCRYLCFEFEILRCRMESSLVILHAKTENGRDASILVKLQHDIETLDFSKLVGHRVEVCGVLGLQIEGSVFQEPGTTGNKIVGYKIFCNSPDNIKILDEKQSSESAPAKSVGLSFINKEKFREGRFLTFGQVCLVDYTDPPAIVLGDGSTFAKFNLSSVEGLKPGMVLRVGGNKIIEPSGQSRLEVDYLDGLTLSELPKAQTFDVKTAAQTIKPNHRISVVGKPVGVAGSDDSPDIILGDGEFTIRVHFQDEAACASIPLHPSIASKIQVTGVTKADEEHDLRLIVSLANDATLVESKASISRIVAIGVGILLAICALSALWIKFLRGQVAQKKRFEAIFDNAGCPIIVFKGDLQIVDANQLAADMLHYSKAELRLASIDDINKSIPTDQLLDLLVQTMHREEVAVFPAQVNTKTNSILDVEVHCRNLTKSDDPSKANYIAVFPDVTARNKYEKELTKARDEAIKANKFKSRFVASMSHELRTPLNGVIGMTQLLERTELTPIQADYLAACRTSGETLLTVIGDVLDFSKMEAGKLKLKPQETHLIPFIENAVRASNLQSAARHVDLASYVDPLLSRSVLIDSDRFQQVIFNLIGNAAKFTSTGCITVTANCTQATSELADVRFIVADTGIGIPQDKIASLFEAFEQTDSSTTRQFGGTGLGLTICKQIVDLMGGKIHVQSVEGIGSKFIVDVRLPFAKQHKTNCLTNITPTGKRVAVLGMSDPISNLLNDLFVGYQVEAEFFNSSEMIPRGKFDVVLINCCDGLETAEDFVATHGNLCNEHGPRCIPVVSADLIVKDSEWERLGLENPLYKPFLQTSLIQAVENESCHNKSVTTKNTATETRFNRPLRVLICEDIPVNQMFAREICKQAGIECVICENGEIAIETLKRDSEFDTIFMDCHMPLMDGFETSRQIRKMTEQGVIRKIPVIALTANALSDDREKCFDCGMDDYLAKPFEIDQFLEKIHSNAKANSSNSHAVIEQQKSFETVFHIEDLVRQIGDRTFVLEIAKQFIDSFPKYSKTLNESLRANDTQETFQIAHRIRGSAGTVRADRIGDAACKLELSARDEQLEQIQLLVGEILHEFEEFKSVYRKEAKASE